MGAYEVANGLENAAVARLKQIYESALRTALRRQHAFLTQIKAIDEGKIKPPQWYVDRGKEKEWREGYTKELLRKNKVIEGIMEDLNAVGGDAADIIREFTCDVYDVTRKETIRILATECGEMGVNPSFATFNKKQIGVLVQKKQSPFSKLAYMNLGKNPAVRRRLQNEMAVALRLGESQQKIVKRIQAVTGQLTWQAKRVAQTERTRVQSQARFEAGAEAAALGVKVYHEWSTRMRNSRDTHIALNGKKAMQGEKFPGSELRYPGDPNAPASETINCHCVLIPGVLLPGEELENKDSSKSLRKENKADTIKVEQCKNFDELEKYISPKYGIDIDASIKNLDFDLVRTAFSGIENALTEIPELKDYIRSAKAKPGDFMSCSYYGDISFDSVVYSNPKELRRMFRKNIEIGYWITGSSPASVGMHEASHLVERALIERSGKYATNREKITAWSKCTEAQAIVSQACKNIKKTPFGKGKTNEQLRRTISGYAVEDASEALADSFESVYIHGEKSSPLAHEIKRLALETLASYKKGGSK